jgi:hypothetical protein
LVTAYKLKKTRFLRLCVGGQKPGFYENIRYRRRNSKKPGFLDYARVARNRVFARIFATVVETQKNPVS